ncbi:ATP synthase gamma chain [bacterium BMS3Abin04]|nr:ATP synthase gamma chain [bacterium BMS3Abin04]
MATLREIKRRIVGVTNTQQITKAMKMVAAARLRRAQDNIINARPYSRKISEVLNHLLSVEKNILNPLLEKRELKRIAIIVITSDRGLCGAFNMNIIKKVEELIDENYADIESEKDIDLYCVGKKGIDYFKRTNYNIVESHSGIFSQLKFEFASLLVNNLTQKFLNSEVDEVVVVYNEFKSVIQQNILVEQLLPIVPDSQKDKNKHHTKNIEYIYEPDKMSIINSLLPRELKTKMWKALLDSYAAELGARMTAMDMATENAKEMIKNLRIKYNKERQASITTEIIEIVSGANALKNA